MPLFIRLKFFKLIMKTFSFTRYLKLNIFPLFHTFHCTATVKILDYSVHDWLTNSFLSFWFRFRDSSSSDTLTTHIYYILYCSTERDSRSRFFYKIHLISLNVSVYTPTCEKVSAKHKWSGFRSDSGHSCWFYVRRKVNLRLY